MKGDIGLFMETVGSIFTFIGLYNSCLVYSNFALGVRVALAMVMHRFPLEAVLIKPGDFGRKFVGCGVPSAAGGIAEGAAHHFPYLLHPPRARSLPRWPIRRRLI